jgi:hypothetical protein
MTPIAQSQAMAEEKAMRAHSGGRKPAVFGKRQEANRRILAQALDESNRPRGERRAEGEGEEEEEKEEEREC